MAARAPIMKSELASLLQLALPIMVSSALTFAMQIVDFAFVGRLGTHELAAAGLGTNFFSLVQHPVFGVASALDTLLAQSHGAQQMQQYRAWVVRIREVLLCVHVHTTINFL